jgi:cytochrome c biogenesis protein CcmG/thiol:disulfide interchange protein DsbE
MTEPNTKPKTVPVLEPNTKPGGPGWRYAIPAVVLAVLVGFFARGLQLNPTYQESPLVCQQAPEFSLPDLADASRRVGSADLAGRMSLINVWATWCIEFRHEHAFLLELARSGVPIYGINWNDDRDEALAWLEDLGNPYVASAFDDVGTVAIDYGVYAAPETFLIGPDLTILDKHFGPLTPAVWSEWVAPAMQARCAGE